MSNIEALTAKVNWQERQINRLTEQLINLRRMVENIAAVQQ